MKKIYGNTRGLKASQLRLLENVYRRKISPGAIASRELVRELSRISTEIRRQVGVLINRQGKIAYLVVGDQRQIMLPNTHAYRSAPGRLRGLRCLHTHLKGEPLTDDDLTDLALLRLDLMAAITIDAGGEPDQVHAAHILPGADPKHPFQIMAPLTPHQLDIDCDAMITAIESELARLGAVHRVGRGSEEAFLVSAAAGPQQAALDSLAELSELAASSGIHVIDTILQLRPKPDPRYLLGRGKLREIATRALHTGATIIVFDQDLSPSQARSITDMIELKVIDRTQLILDIFAQRARTREGKLQVELAQLKYILPRLATRNSDLSRLTGGIGGRGPGETKLEIDRRRIRQRIISLENALLNVRKHRAQQRARRQRQQVPVVSIIGYTNAGKSTLLNTLTHSQVLAESRLFATLDPSSRRVRFPQDLELILTDTVGFIQNLPQDLVTAFRATLEELESADLLLHVIDISNPHHSEQIAAVEAILADLSLTKLPSLRVLNKIDKVDPRQCAKLVSRLKGIGVSALDRQTLLPLIEKISAYFFAK